MFLIRYQQAQMALMEAAVELTSAEDELADAINNYWQKPDRDTVEYRVNKAKHLLEAAARDFTIECRMIKPE